MFERPDIWTRAGILAPPPLPPTSVDGDGDYDITPEAVAGEAVSSTPLPPPPVDGVVVPV